MNVSAWRLIRAVRGPIMLIAFGALMALNHTDKISFERTWPVLIILYGVFKLLERMLAPQAVPPQWPSAGYAPQYPPAQYPAQPYQPQQPPQYPHGGGAQ